MTEVDNKPRSASEGPISTVESITQPVTMLHSCICTAVSMCANWYDGLNVFAATAVVKQRQGVTVAAEVQVCGG